MANNRTTVDAWEVKDLEDNSTITVQVEHNTEMGNKNLSGLLIRCFGQMVAYEPVAAGRWAYEARKAKATEYFLDGPSWTVYEDTFIKHYFVPGAVPKAKIEVKVRSEAAPVIREYELPFTLED